uniref:FAD-dependent oxidoreductase 2 FAD binding domain-containing protein n=1 Tax=Panagrolaimus sp. PS1159 TaxID=55785 RepID=A0AC35GKW3_9BILA
MSTQQLAPNDLKPLKTKAPQPNEPIIIVGGGLAGLSAALEALRSDATVILIDKSKDLGGNSAKASSGINGVNTETQRKMHIEDSTDKFYSDTLSAGDRENDPTLVDLLVQESNSAVEFLIDAGVDLTDINLCGGHSVPRTHWIPSPKEGRPIPVGFSIIKNLKTKNDFVTGVRIKNSTGHLGRLFIFIKTFFENNIITIQITKTRKK